MNELGTRTHKRGDRRRRRTRGGSSAVVGMAANPSGAHQVDDTIIDRSAWRYRPPMARCDAPANAAQ